MTRFQDYADWILINADFLHFGLTGTSAFDPAKNDLLSRAVLGEHSLEDGIDGFLGLTWNQELAATIDRLESLDRSELRKQFSIKRLNEMEIYPGVTFSEELEGNSLLRSCLIWKS